MCFFFNDTATTEIYTLSLHDALPISGRAPQYRARLARLAQARGHGRLSADGITGLKSPCGRRPEEHTSELQPRPYLVCRLLLEKTHTKRAIPPRALLTLLIAFIVSLF